MAKGKGVGQDGPRPEDKGKGKEVKPLPEAKGTEATLTIKNAVSKAKAADLKDEPSRAKV